MSTLLINADSPTSEWTFYAIGILLLLLGVAFILVPLVGKSLAPSGVRIPWFILYVYNKGGFYFVTSPFLIVASIIGVILMLVFRR